MTTQEPSPDRKRRARIVIGTIAVFAAFASLFLTSSNAYRMEPGPLFSLKDASATPTPYDLEDTAGDWYALTVHAYPLNLAEELYLDITGQDDLIYKAAAKDSPYNAETAAEADAARQHSLNAALQAITTEGESLLILQTTDSTGAPDGSRLLAVNGNAPSAGPVPAGSWLVVEPDGAIAHYDVTVSNAEAVPVEGRDHPNHLRPLAPDLDAVTTPGFNLEQVGGSSAGLIQALAWVDVLTEGDLTNGLTIAATGTLDQEGNVLPVSGVPMKLQAAAEADVDLAIIPSDYDEPTPEGLRVVKVDTVQEALDALAQHQ